MLTAHNIRRLAVEARRDPRTIRNVLHGRAKGVAELAVREAAERLGLTLPVTGPPTQSPLAGDAPPRPADTETSQ